MICCRQSAISVSYHVYNCLQSKKFESRVDKCQVRGQIRWPFIGSLKTGFDVEDDGRALRNHSHCGVCVSKYLVNFMRVRFRVI